MDTIKDTIEETKKKGRKTLLKVVAVAVSTGLLAVGAVAALDNLQTSGSGIDQVTEPEPVVLDIDEADMTDESDTEEDEQEEKKRGFFSWLKIWFYGMLTGIAGFFATIQRFGSGKSSPASRRSLRRRSPGRRSSPSGI